MIFAFAGQQLQQQWVQSVINQERKSWVSDDQMATPCNQLLSQNEAMQTIFVIDVIFLTF